MIFFTFIFQIVPRVFGAVGDTPTDPQIIPAMLSSTPLSILFTPASIISPLRWGRMHSSSERLCCVRTSRPLFWECRALSRLSAPHALPVPSSHRKRNDTPQLRIFTVIKRTLLFIQVQPSLRGRGALCQSALAVHPLTTGPEGGRSRSTLFLPPRATPKA